MFEISGAKVLLFFDICKRKGYFAQKKTHPKMRFFCYRQYLLELVVAVEGGFGSLAGSLSPLRTLRSARALRFRSLPPCSPSALPARAHTVSDRVSLKKVYKSLFFERPQGARVAIMCVGCVVCVVIRVLGARRVCVGCAFAYIGLVVVGI